MNMRPQRRELATIELTPLIDVVFLLLIFFLLTSSISQAQQNQSRDSLLPVDLPRAESGERNIQGDPITLTVANDGKIVLEGGDGDLEGVSIEEKLINLYKTDPNAQILLRGDKSADYGRVTELLNVVRQIGFKRADLVITAPKKK